MQKRMVVASSSRGHLANTSQQNILYPQTKPRLGKKKKAATDVWTVENEKVSHALQELHIALSFYKETCNRHSQARIFLHLIVTGFFKKNLWK